MRLLLLPLRLLPAVKASRAEVVAAREVWPYRRVVLDAEWYCQKAARS